MTIRNYMMICQMPGITEAFNNPMWAKANNKSFYDLLNSWITVGEVVPTDEELTFFQLYFFPHFCNEKIEYIDQHAWYPGQVEDPTEEDWESKMPEICGKMYRWYIASCERYLPLIQMYANNLDNLLGQVKSYSVNRFNDTPQNQHTSDLDIEDNLHNTTVTKVESSTDGDTLINRLTDIRAKLISLYEEWANSFSRFIIGD